MIYLKSESEIEKLREAAQLVSRTLAEVAKKITPGVQTGTLDRIAEDFIKKNNFRITMHPGPYTILNSLKQKVVDKAVKELQYHDNFLTSLGLNSAAKINIHVGGVYDDKEKSLQRFIKNYHRLPASIKKRLVIENDEKSYNFSDCLKINKKTGMVIDFSDLKSIVNKQVISVLDHSFLNEIIYNPTAENLLIWIWEKLMFDGLLKGIHKIELWEASDSVAIMDEKGMRSILINKEQLQNQELFFPQKTFKKIK